MSFILVLIGFVTGAAIIWFAIQRSLAHEQQRRAGADSTVGAQKQQIIELRMDLERTQQSLMQESANRASAEAKLSESQAAEQRLMTGFKALSDDALKSNNQAFLQLAQQTFTTLWKEAQGDLGKRQEAIQYLVQPLQNSLKDLQDHSTSIEKQRQEAYGDLRSQLQTMAKVERDLVSAFKQPQSRGRWGELTLRRVVELAGLVEHCDFVEQVSVSTDERRLQPDLVVHLPGHCQIIVDAKTPLDSYLAASEETDEARQAEALRKHAAMMRAHMMQLASKSYWQQFESADYVVMFVPGDPFLSAACQVDPSLIEDALASKVVLATPTNLVALMKSAAYSWRHEQLSHNAQLISQLGREVYSRLLTLQGHIEALRKNIQGSVASFNGMVGSLESRVLPGLRRFRELGAGEAEVHSVAPIETSPRQLAAPEAEDSAQPAGQVTKTTENVG